MSPKITQPREQPREAETLGAGFALERVFREGTRVRHAFDNALLRQHAFELFNVNALSHYEILDHVTDGKLRLATQEEVQETRHLYPELRFTPLKKNIRTPVVLLYNKAKFGEKVDLTRDGLLNMISTSMISTSNKISLGATYGASRSAIQRFLSYGQTPEQVALLREQIRSKAEHPQIASLGKDFAIRAIIVNDYNFISAPANLAQSYYRLNDKIGFATLNGKEYFESGYELFHEFTHIIHNGKNTKKVKVLRNALMDKKLTRALERQSVIVDDPTS